jgi:hypothetical protein
LSRRSLIRTAAGSAAATAGVLLVVLLLAGCGGSSSRPAAVHLSARLPSDFFGIVSEDAFSGTPAYRRRALRLQSLAGAGLVRQTFDWSQIETAPGRFDFSRYDGFVGAAAKAGMEVMPIVQKAPRFRAAALPGARPNATFPPRHFGDFGDFVERLARRYGSRGSFWSDHAGLPRYPIRYWQIWNEPSLPAYWGHPDPAAYTRLLKTAGPALRKADPKAMVVSAGIPNSRLGIPFEAFVKGMYEAGAKGAFDIMAVHPYARDDEGVLAAVEQARGIVRDHGDHAPIWVTELGWASGGPPSPFTAGRLGQAVRIRRSLRLLVQHRQELGIRGAVYYNWRDAPPYPPYYHDFWGLHTGLHERSGRPKAALAAFSGTVRGLLRRYGDGRPRAR